jgi:hypothetical protein
MQGRKEKNSEINVMHNWKQIEKISKLNIKFYEMFNKINI